MCPDVHPLQYQFLVELMNSTDTTLHTILPIYLCVLFNDTVSATYWNMLSNDRK
jgi:hypothetical protein